MIFRDGMITQSDRQIGAVGLFAIDETADSDARTNSSIIPSIPATAVLDFVATAWQQGFIESANVNPVDEMAQLIGASRAFDSASADNDMLD